jgi:transcriptional regulator with XRE-family HTH domain
MQNLVFMARLERVKQKRGWSWEQTAQAMNLSRSMLHFIKTGKYLVSEKAVKSLRLIETQTGISPVARSVIEALSKEAERAKPKISKADINAGQTEVEVKFVSGIPPANLGNKVRLTRPDIRVRAKLVGDILVEENYHPVLLACLPPELANDSFLNLLSPFSYNSLAETAMTLVFGPDWQQELPGLSE